MMIIAGLGSEFKYRNGQSYFTILKEVDKAEFFHQTARQYTL